MTEDEAKTKWCPFAKPSETSALRYVDASRPQHSLCIGSACMAWRWLPPLWEFRSYGGGTYTEPKEVNGYGVEGTPLPREGFCGFAGPPHG